VGSGQDWNSVISFSGVQR